MDALISIIDLLDSLSGHKYLNTWLKEKRMFSTKSKLYINILSMIIMIILILLLFVIGITMIRIF